MHVPDPDPSPSPSLGSDPDPDRMVSLTAFVDLLSQSVTQSIEGEIQREGERETERERQREGLTDATSEGSVVPSGSGGGAEPHTAEPLMTSQTCSSSLTGYDPVLTQY